MKTSQKGFVPVVLAVIIILIVGGYLAYRYSARKQVSNSATEIKPPVVPDVGISPAPIQPTTVTPTMLQSADETANWKTYRNERYRFELRYPDNIIVVDATLDHPAGTCVFFRFLAHRHDRILINSGGAETMCGMTTGRGAFDKDIKGELIVGDNVYNATGYSADDYEELDARLANGVYVRYWIDKGVQFAQHKEVVKKILSTFTFTK